MKFIYIAVVLLSLVLVSNARWIGKCDRDFHCPKGTHCEIVGDWSVCVTDIFGNFNNSLCDFTKCPFNYNCDEISRSVVTCEPKSNRCDHIRCPIGTFCLSKFGGTKCIPASIFPDLCKTTECPRGFNCHIIRGQPTCTRNNILPSRCLTCADIECNSNSQHCVTVPNPFCRVQNGFNPNCCQTLPRCEAVPTTTSTTSSSTGASTTATSTSGASTTATSTTGASTTATSTSGTSATATSTTGASTTATSTAGTTTTSSTTTP